MSKNLKVALIVTVIVAIAVIGYFYKSHEDSKIRSTIQPSNIKAVEIDESTAPVVVPAENAEHAEAVSTAESTSVATPVVVAPVKTPAVKK